MMKKKSYEPKNEKYYTINGSTLSCKVQHWKRNEDYGYDLSCKEQGKSDYIFIPLFCAHPKDFLKFAIQNKNKLYRITLTCE